VRHLPRRWQRAHSPQRHTAHRCRHSRPHHHHQSISSINYQRSSQLTKPHAGKGEATSQHHHRGQQTKRHEVTQTHRHGGTTKPRAQARARVAQSQRFFRSARHAGVATIMICVPPRDTSPHHDSARTAPSGAPPPAPAQPPTPPINQSIKGPHKATRGQGRSHITAPAQGAANPASRSDPDSQTQGATVLSLQHEHGREWPNLNEFAALHVVQLQPAWRVHARFESEQREVELEAGVGLERAQRSRVAALRIKYTCKYTLVVVVSYQR